MKLQQLTYLFSIVIFAGTTILVKWHRDKRILKKYELVILAVMAISLPFAVTDYFALKWGAWSYNSAHTLNVNYGTKLETYIFSAAVACIMALVTIASAARIDRFSETKSKRK